MKKRLRPAPREISIRFSAVYTRDIVWRTAVAILLELVRDTGARLQVVHTHAPGSLRLLREAKAAGVGVIAAADPKYFHLREEDIHTQGVRAIPGGAVTSDPERMAEIWRSIDDGTIDLIDSDHAPHTLDDLKLMEEDPLIGTVRGAALRPHTLADADRCHERQDLASASGADADGDTGSDSRNVSREGCNPAWIPGRHHSG